MPFLGLSRNAFVLVLYLLGFSYADDATDQCRLYLGESSIPNGGLGMYTSVDLKKGERVGWPDMLINVVQARDTGLLLDYYWNSWKWIPEGRRTSGLETGFGMAANSHLGLMSVSQRAALVQNDHLSGFSSSPASGAITPYFNMEWYQDQDFLVAGSELFVDYGSNYFLGREQSIGVIPVYQHYRFADQLSVKMTSFFEKFNTKLTAQIKEVIWETMRTHIVDDKRNRVALPDSVEDLAKVSPEKGGVASLGLPNRVRSQEWLQQNATCMDNLYPANSTIVPEAGRGAFAARDLLKGTVIAPSPVVHASDDHLSMVATTRDPINKGISLNPNITVGQELLVNYCFGHSQSSMKFFPYASWVYYVNHAPTPEHVNVKLQWSRSASHKSHWLTKSVKEVMEEPHAGLILDLVATRDIEEGEEVFLDYGAEWIAAWKTHETKWDDDKKKKGAKDTEASERSGPLNLRTVAEQQTNPYPPDYMTTCYVTYGNMPQQTKSNSTELSPRSFTKEDIVVLDDDIILASAYKWDESFAASRQSNYHPCQIVWRNNTGGEAATTTEAESYLILIQSPNGDDSYKFFKNVPPHGIHLAKKPYSTSVFAPGAFRHYIGIPDDIFPAEWKDLK